MSYENRYHGLDSNNEPRSEEAAPILRPFPHIEEAGFTYRGVHEVRTSDVDGKTYIRSLIDGAWYEYRVVD